MNQAELRVWLRERAGALAGLPAGEVGADRSFSELGLDSALLTRLAGELEELLGRTVEPSVLFEHPTVAALAEALLRPATAAPHVPARAPGQGRGRGSVPIAVVGLACRFPGASGPAEFWRLLRDGVDAVGEVPGGRWGGRTGAGGFLEDVAGFDADFFGIRPAEAARMDPQQRLLLEVCREALDDAGEPAAALRGTATGVYVGISSSEYAQRQLADLASVSAHTSTGGSPAVAAGRVAHLLDLTGPALSVDTACSSSLVAVHLACRAIRSGECDRAIAAGVNVLLDPELTASLELAGMLSADGRCKVFDAAADGYVRGEGCGAVLLRPLPEALAAGDRVYAVIRGSAVNSDGASNGLTAPNPAAQRAVLRAAYGDAGVDPATVGYVECHGTGTPLGDPIETGALGAVVGGGRTAPCLVGSVKTNLGHLEPAAGIAGLIKVCLSLHHGEIPPTLHLREPNPRIAFDDLGLRPVTSAVPWAEGPNVAGVSGFGFSGTNAHVVLEGVLEGRAPASERGDAPWVLPLSARSEEGLERLRRSMPERLVADPDAAYTAAVRRSHHRPYRLAVVLPGDTALAARPVAEAAEEARPLLVFSGQGSQWAGMGRDLLGAFPRFASTLRRCDDAVAGELGWAPSEALRGLVPVDLGDTAVAQPLTVAVQVALARLLGTFGVEPAGVAGHSVGEISAAVVAGLLTLEEGMRLAVRRGAAMAEAASEGGMLAVAAGRAELSGLLGGAIELAAENGPRSCVLSGDTEALTELRTRLEAAGTGSSWVPVAYAFHSARMAPAADRLTKDLTAGGFSVPDAEPVVPMYSTVLGRRVTGADLDAAYWARGVRDPVEFAAAVRASGADLAVEVGGHPVLRTPLRDLGLTSLPTLQRDRDGARSLLETLARLYELGCDVDWRPAWPDGGRVVSLPAYPWRHERHWIDRPPAHVTAGNGLLGARVELAAGPKVWQSAVAADRPSGLADHRVGGAVLLPAAAYLEMIRLAAAELGHPAAVRNLTLHHPLALDQTPVTLQTTLTADGDGYAVAVHGRRDGDWTLYAEAGAGPADGPVLTEAASAGSRCLTNVPVADLYAALAAQGLDYGPAFRRLGDVWRGEGEAIAAVTAGPPLSDVAVLDAALQVVGVAAALGRTEGRAVPVAVAEAALWRPPGEATRVHGRVRSMDDTELTADVALLGEGDVPVGELRGLRVRRSPQSETAARRDGYEIVWRPAEPVAGVPRGRWLILPDRSGVAAAVAARLAEAGAAAEVADELTDAGGLDGVLCLWGLDPSGDPVALPAAVAALLRELSFTTGDMPRLLVATRGAQPVAGGVADPSPSTVWGLLKTAPIENPTLRLGCVDLDPDASPADQAVALCAELAAPVEDAAATETETGYRAGRRYVRRIAPAAFPRTGTIGLDPDGAYVITGGTGGLGRALARFLAERGAGLVALIARGASPTAVSGRVVEVRADVADPADLGAALETVRKLGRPIRGVAHAAGVLRDGALLDLTPEELRTVLAPKALGARNLNELTRDDPLQWFVLFSSAAGVLGSPGQAGYAAANAYLDAFAHHRRAAGRPALTVDWGPWARAGMAAGPAETAEQRRLRTGTGTIDPEEGLRTLERLLAAGRTQAVVVAFELRNLLQYYPTQLGMAFFAEVADDATRLKSVAVQSTARPHTSAEYVAPRGDLERRIAAIWQRSLGIEAVGVFDTFFELGGDSVFGNQILVEIGRSLGVRIDPATAFADFTVARLAELAEAQLIERLEQMSDEEAARLLAAEETP